MLADNSTVGVSAKIMRQSQKCQRAGAVLHDNEEENEIIWMDSQAGWLDRSWGRELDDFMVGRGGVWDLGRSNAAAGRTAPGPQAMWSPSGQAGQGSAAQQVVACQQPSKW